MIKENGAQQQPSMVQQPRCFVDISRRQFLRVYSFLTVLYSPSLLQEIGRDARSTINRPHSRAFTIYQQCVLSLFFSTCIQLLRLVPAVLVSNPTTTTFFFSLLFLFSCCSHQCQLDTLLLLWLLCIVSLRGRCLYRLPAGSSSYLVIRARHSSVLLRTTVIT